MKAVLLGSAFCLALLVLFASLGIGIVLNLDTVTRGELPPPSQQWLLLAGAGLGLAVAYFGGGFAAGRLRDTTDPTNALLLGLGTWAVVSCFLSFVVADRLMAHGSRLAEWAGLGVGASTGISATLEQLTEMNPRIVTDVNLLDGRIVSRVHLDEPEGTVAAEAAQEAKKLGGRLPAKEIREKAGEVRALMARAGLAGFASLLLGALAAGFGGRLGKRPTPPAGATQERARAA